MITTSCSETRRRFFTTIIAALATIPTGTATLAEIFRPEVAYDRGNNDLTARSGGAEETGSITLIEFECLHHVVLK